jgi:hypothetical protein
MDEVPELESGGYWRTAVWALRVGFAALAIVIVGLIVMLLGSTPWVLGGFIWARHLLPKPRPGFWSMRFMLIHDTVHIRSSAQKS